MFQRIMSVVVIILSLIAFLVAYKAMEYGFKWTFGPFDEIPVQYKWLDAESGRHNCIVKVPGESAMECGAKPKEELAKYKLLWEKPSPEVLAEKKLTRIE